MRDEDEETRPLRFGATREGVVPLGRQLSDAEDRYFGGSTMMGIEREEYDALVNDSTILAEMEEALIDFINEIRLARKEPNTRYLIFTEDATDKMVGRVGALTGGLKKATGRE